jgi:hypothetical protein
MALLRTDILEEHIACIIRVTRIGELGTTLAVTSNCSMLRKKWHNIPEDGILYRKCDVSGTGSISVFRRKDATPPLGPLERLNLSHWVTTSGKLLHSV